MLNVRFTDHTGSIWVSIGDVAASKLISTSAKQIMEYENQNELLKQEALNESLNKEFRVRIVTRIDLFQG